MTIVQFFINNPAWYLYCAGITMVILALAEKYRWWNADYRWFWFPDIIDTVIILVLCTVWPLTLFMLSALRFVGFIGWLFKTGH